ncbi:MAG: deoxynucleoside kinase [Thermodesulfobacteriota bacterium]
MKYIAVEGPIGVGKTSLAELLCQEFGGKGVYEDVETNPFLKDFYLDRKKYALQTQLFFLLARYQQQRELNQQDLFDKVIVSDYLFAKDWMFACINLDDNEIILYQQIYKMLDAEIPTPDLVIFLNATSGVLMDRIRQRGKGFEKGIEMDYLDRVTQAYRRFFFHYNKGPLLVVDVSDIDFVNSQDDFKSLVKEIRHMKKGTQYYIPRFASTHKYYK